MKGEDVSSFNDVRIQVEQQCRVQQQISRHLVPEVSPQSFSLAISPNGLLLVGDIAKRLAEIMRKTALKYRAEIIALEIIPDHVHMLCEVDPQFGIHCFVKRIKGVTSHVLRKEFVSLRKRLEPLQNRSHSNTVVPPSKG